LKQLNGKHLDVKIRQNLDTGQLYHRMKNSEKQNYSREGMPDDKSGTNYGGK